MPKQASKQLSIENLPTSETLGKSNMFYFDLENYHYQYSCEIHYSKLYSIFKSQISEKYGKINVFQKS